MRRLVAAAAMALVLAPLVAPAGVRAAEYEMSTTARYVVDVAAAAVVVTVDVAFTNTTPNPPGAVSGFDHVDLALQSGASEVSARDGKGPLVVALVDRDGATVASVKVRARVRYKRSTSFTLSYRLPDGAAPDLHVRSEILKFPVWGFGTSSQVTVEMPGDYQARVDGDPMAIDTVDGILRLSSGQLADPASWLALVTASRPSETTTLRASVALASGTVDLQVRCWTGDLVWGNRTLAMLQRALPLLEDAVGLPYPRVGPLIVTEVVGDTASDLAAPSTTAELQVAFDADAFTLLHQAAHIWIGPQLASDAWIREGLASHVAGTVATEMGESLPYDPATRAADLGPTAIPLVGWGSDAAGPAEDEYGYAASWAFMDEIAAAVGDDSLRVALQRVASGLTAYDPAAPDPTQVGARPFTPVDTRSFLDQLAAVSEMDLAGRFRAVVLGAAADVELAARAASRRAYAGMLDKAGDWGAPGPIRGAMAGWRFDEARPAIIAATAWLDRRDAVLGDAAAAGLAAPNRLQATYQADGGGADASAELAAEQAVVDAYRQLRTRAEAPRGPLDTIGLLGSDDPAHFVEQAAASFSAGDLQAATDALSAAEVQLDRAAANGLVRLVSAAILLTVAALLGVVARRRSGSHYTARP
jgi:hypothetical protein